MKPDDNWTPLIVPERRVTPPQSVSPKAREALSAAAALPPPEPFPALTNGEGWRRLAAENQKRKLALKASAPPAANKVTTEELMLGGARVYRIEPPGAEKEGKNILIDIHGGAFIFNSGEICCDRGIEAAVAYSVTTFAIDYRMPPEHPYPAGLEDCVNAYQAILKEHGAGRIVVQGISAGGNLAAALILRLRDAGLPRPAGVILRTPEVDLTESGDSFQTNRGLDTILTQSLMPINLLYANGHDLRDPYLSPLFGDFKRGFAPTVLTGGTRDLFLSNAVRMHLLLRRAGVEADLILEEAAPHGGIANTPESEEHMQEMRRLAEGFWSRSKR